MVKVGLALLNVIVLTCLGCTPLRRSPASARSVPTSAKFFSLAWPVDRARLTQKFKPSGAKRHWGLDLAARKNSPIYAAHYGRVVYTGQGFSGYGKLIIIEFGDTWASFYSHMSKILVKTGDWVNQGDKIALMGRTGRATGVHLHFELRKNKKPVNPLTYLP